jgi:hypothetical protein
VTHDEPAVRGGRPGLLALTFTVPIGMVTFVYGFLTAYMLNDQIGSEDHLRFLTPVAAGVLLSTALTATLLGRDATRQHPLATALAWCCGTTAAAAVVVVALTA